MSSQLSYSDQLSLIEKLRVFRFQGRDKLGRPLLIVIGKFFPARSVGLDAVKGYLEERIYPSLENSSPFSVLYVHTDVDRSDNFPGIAALRSIYDSVPSTVKNNLEALYILHPGLHARLFLATVGRLFFFSCGLYGKVRYVNRLDTLWWEHVRRSDVELPDFVYEYDEELENRPTMMDYGMESDHPRVVYGGAPSSSMDSSVAMYSMRCIS